MSTNKYAPAGRMDLESQGYRLTWGPKGLIVEVTDYHTRPLGLPWSLLRELVDAAAQSPDRPSSS
jgi:hypothetical protein